MIVLTEFFLAMAVALTLSLVLVLFFRWERPSREGPWASFVLLFVLLMLFTWAGGVWLGPLGPTVWNVYWVPFGLTGLILALVLAAAISPPREPSAPQGGEEQAPQVAGQDADAAEMTVAKAFGVTFWLLVLSLVILIIARHVV